MTDSQRILDTIRRLVRMLRVSDRSAQSQLGISGAQLFVLRVLRNTPGLSLNELASRTRTDQSSVSVVVGRLVDAGLLNRQRDDRDARRLILNLTPKGSALIDQAPRSATERMLEVFDGMPPADRKRFADEFEDVLHRIGTPEAGSAPMLFEDDPDQTNGALLTKESVSEE